MFMLHQPPAPISMRRSRPNAKPTPRSSRSLPSTRQAIIAAAAADFDEPLRCRDDQLKDHLAVEPDPAPEAEIDLDTFGAQTLFRHLTDRAHSNRR